MITPLIDYKAPPGLLDGQTILITGASRGIGRAVAAAAARVGAQTILMARKVQELEALADEIVAKGQLEPGIIPINFEGASVADYADVCGLIDSRYGRLDGLLLNAGILGEMSPISSYDPITWARVFQINVHSQFLLVQASLELLSRSEHGSILFTSSGVGRKGRAYWGAYAAAKFAVEGLMQTLADELAGASRIRVNALNPGRVRTQMRAEAYPAENPAELRHPDELANAYLYLLGRDSSEIHGQSLDAQGAR